MVRDIISSSRALKGGEQFIRKEIYLWSVTQNYNISQQLELGIRYFDLRILYKEQEDKLYTYHGLTGASLDVILSQMANFLQMHQKEVLFLDFNHLHIITSKGLQELRRILNSTFGSKIYRGQDSELSLTDIWRNRSNIIIFFRGVRKINTPSVYNAHVFDESHLLSPFDTSKFYEFSTWRDYLKEIYKNRPRSHTFYVTQGIMQPNLLSIAASSLIKNGSLESLISDGATKALVKWLRTCKSGTSGVNIVIADFIQKYNFVETVLNLNMSNS